ncbi:hypothetical protein HAHE_42140 [Haloferula helveola]|uniref:SPW repeat-containing protein n=1 Tax=Haloferula helveola TaxID=490095 RepID=A0ABM7REY5_9BACT|nr:hypothetical protein HAHE_42140 [Haloferula helveola]
MTAPRVVAGVLALAGGYWAITLSSWLAFPIGVLVLLPGFAIWVFFGLRVLSKHSKPWFVAGWLFAMVWHLAIATWAPLISGLLDNAQFIRAPAAAAATLSLAGFLLEIRRGKHSTDY